MNLLKVYANLGGYMHRLHVSKQKAFLRTSKEFLFPKEKRGMNHYSRSVACIHF